MPPRIPLDIRPVIVEKVELNAVVLRPAQGEEIVAPVVGADLLRVARAFAVDPLHAIGGKETRQWRFRFRSTVFPKRAPQGIPNAGEAFLVSVPVLRDDALNPIRVAQRDSEPHWGTVVLNEERKLLHPNRYKQLFHHLRQFVERV